jgi:hypothetical protein
MPKKVISMLEFLRTGILGGIKCGCTTNDVIGILGKPDYETFSSDFPDISWFHYDSLEVWFHTDLRIVYRFTLQRFHRYKNKRNYFATDFHLGTPKISGAKVDPWVIRQNLDLGTMQRFLKSAKIEFRHSQWRAFKPPVDQLDLDSGVVMLFDPATEDDPGLGYISKDDDELRAKLFPNWW